MASLSLRFLGSFQALLGNEPVTGFRSDKTRALLVYLALESDRPHRRDALATLLWGDYGDKAARTSLRMALSNLRKIVAPQTDAASDQPLLDITPQYVQFHRNPSAVWVDVAAFEDGLNACKAHPHQDLSRCTACVQRLAEAVALYRGEFLAGFSLSASPAFDEWRVVRQEALHQQALNALHMLAVHHLACRQYERAQTYARRQLSLAPWHEGAHCQLMLALALDGQRAAALAQYELCRQTLADELGVEPSRETRALARAIEAGTLPEPALDLSAAEEVPQPPHNLPIQLTPFIGREEELTQLRRRLLDPAYRLLTLAGAGGVGKTRLALVLAEQVRHLFPDGTWFVPLTGLTGHDTPDDLADAIAAAIAGALGFPFHGQESPRAQLLDYLRAKHLLLVLDNFEHLVDAAGYLTDILRSAAQVSLLVTSRQRLALQAEYVHHLVGLPVPQSAQEEGAARYSSVLLFTERAERTAASFSLTDSELPHVIEVCHLVDGSPLAIELAAAWTGHRTCAEVAAAIRRSLDFLATGLRDVPERHRSMRAVFEQSWRLLSDRERVVLARMSLFRGGFERDAALAVTDASGRDLAMLVDKSLLKRTARGRYELHELVRQFVADKRREMARQEQLDEAALRARHAAFYLGFVGERNELLYTGNARQALADIRLDSENVRRAWEWAAQRPDVDGLAQGLSGLARYFVLTGQFREGETAIDRAITRLEENDPSTGTIQRLLSRLLAERSRFMRLQGRFGPAMETAEAAVTYAQAAGATDQEANGHLQGGLAIVRSGDFQAAHPVLGRAIALARSAGDRQLEAESLRAQAVALFSEGAYALADGLYRQALALSQALGDRQLEGQILNGLGITAWNQGDAGLARHYFEQALTVFRELDARKDQSLLLVNLGFMTHYQGDYQAATDYYQDALLLCRDMGRRRIEGTVLSGLGFVSAELGDHATARAYYEQALRLCRSIGDREGESWRLTYLSLLHHQLGDQQAAIEYGRQALHIAQASGSRPIQAHALTNIGHALTALDRRAEAAAAYQQALEMRQQMGEKVVAIESQAGLARVLLAEGRPEALTHVEEILAFLEQGNLDGTDEPFRIYLTCYHVLQAHGDGRARSVLATAQRLLQERAANINDEALRHSFLHEVPAHRQVLRA